MVKYTSSLRLRRKTITSPNYMKPVTEGNSTIDNNGLLSHFVPDRGLPYQPTYLSDWLCETGAHSGRWLQSSSSSVPVRIGGFILNRRMQHHFTQRSQRAMTWAYSLVSARDADQSAFPETHQKSSRPPHFSGLNP